MPNPATVRERRLRKTKAQLVDEIDTLEQRVAAMIRSMHPDLKDRHLDALRKAGLPE